MSAPLKLSVRASSLQPSLTLAIAAKAKQLRADGCDICSLSAGEPDFDTPAFIRQAAAAALEAGHTRYGPVAGEPALRAAIAEKLSQENGVAATPGQVLVTNGGKQALFNLFQVLLNPGDGVVKCRPPDNRKPTPEEMAACRPWLMEQIALVDPAVIVL
ncbi:MAG: aminotransferase class I/II-fold pyridoxal phosphate-dependent enzyme, partial [Cyanobium sp.]